MAKDDLEHHPCPPQPLPLLLLRIPGSIGVVVDQAPSTVGAQESLTGSVVDGRSQHMSVPYLCFQSFAVVNQGGIMTQYESSRHNIEVNITWSTNGEGENFAGTLMSPTIT